MSGVRPRIPATFDPVRDARRVGVGLAVATAALAAALAIAATRPGAGRSVGALQRRFAGVAAAANAGGHGGAVVPGVVEVHACDGELDRCPSCHLGTERRDLAAATVLAPFRAHPDDPHHARARLGCSSCHGGTGRALVAEVAHGARGGGGRDPRLRLPHLEASCARCHVPGAVAGTERLARGALLYLQLGCPGCHPPVEGGRGGLDFGPDLRAIGRRGPAYLETSLVDPAANFRESTMPSFRDVLAADPEGKLDLLVYLQSLVLATAPAGSEAGGGPTSCRRVDGAAASLACTACHGDGGAPASGRLRHRCTYLTRRASELRCPSCHASRPGAADGTGACPIVAAHLPACGACHEDAGAWADAGRAAPGIPAAAIPAAGVPAADVPAAAIPDAGVPAGGVPAGGVPAGGAPR